MSDGDIPVLVLSDEEAASPTVPVVDLEMAAEETVELDSTLEDLMVVRSGGQGSPVAPPIKGDDKEEISEEDVPLNTRALSPGVFFGERDSRTFCPPQMHQLWRMKRRPDPKRRRKKRKRKLWERGNVEEPLQTDAAILIAEGSSSQATPRKKGKIIIQNAVNVTIEGEVNVIGSIMIDRDLAKIMDMYGPPNNVVWRFPEEREVACSYTVHDICLFDCMFPWGIRIVLDPKERPPGSEFLAAILASCCLSPGQLTTNAFMLVLGFWAFMYL